VASSVRSTATGSITLSNNNRDLDNAQNKRISNTIIIWKHIVVRVIVSKDKVSLAPSVSCQPLHSIHITQKCLAQLQEAEVDNSTRTFR